MSDRPLPTKECPDIDTEALNSKRLWAEQGEKHPGKDSHGGEAERVWDTRTELHLAGWWRQSDTRGHWRRVLKNSLGNLWLLHKVAARRGG